MCGIVGMVAKTGRGFFSKDADVFENMLIADSIRGDDSTGVFSVTNRNQINVVKQAVEPGMFIKMKSYKDWRGEVVNKCSVAVGHNRKATVGEVISKNAHPFVKNGVVLVHNGYIGNSRQLDSSVSVDSEAILTALETDKDPVKGLEKLFGAWALAWYSQKESRLYLTHNNERPLALCHTDNVLFFASEAKMIDWLLSRESLKHQDPIELKPHTLYTINVKNFEISTKDVPFRTARENWAPVTVWHESEIDNALERLGETSNRGDDEEADDEFELEARHRRHPLDRNTGKPLFIGERDPAVGGRINTSEVTKRMFGIYPEKSTILFLPKNHVINKDEVTIYGKVFLPGKEVFQGTSILRKGKDDKLFFNWTKNRAPLLGEIAMISRRGDNIKFGVTGLRDPLETFKDSVGQSMSHLEWKHICDHLGCSKCAKGPHSHQVEFVTINRKDGGYDIVCADCLLGGRPGSKKLPVVDENGKPVVNP